MLTELLKMKNHPVIVAPRNHKISAKEGKHFNHFNDEWITNNEKKDTAVAKHESETVLIYFIIINTSF